MERSRLNLTGKNGFMISGYSPYLIPPVLSLVTAYALAAVAATWGKINREKIMLALICFWWSLLSWAFIIHNIVKDPAIIMKAERMIHTVYVFVPAVSLAFFQDITGLKNRCIRITLFVISMLFAIFVQTDNYFYGFNNYRWGMIARGGMAFMLFSTYGTLATFYIFYLFMKKLRSEKNRVLRLKLNYLFISYFISVILTMTNVPAMNGIDFYPLGNLMFIPLGIMTYGILRYRLIEISSVVHYAFFWLVLSSLIVIPNLFIFRYVSDAFNTMHTRDRLLVFISWFGINYFYYNRIQPVINRLLNRKKYILSRMEKSFIRDLTFLKNLDELKNELVLVLGRTLDIPDAGLYLRTRNQGIFRGAENQTVMIDEGMMSMLAQCDEIVLQKSILESKPDADTSCASVAGLMVSLHCEYLVPLRNQDELIALIVLPDKRDRRQFTSDEYRFIRSIAAYASIALANSVMFQNLSDIKDNLEMIVEERTSLIEKQKSELENDIQFARKIQMSLLPKNIPSVKNMEFAYRYEPVLGVGGDFLDIHYREGMNQVGLFICDVSGHGASSAMIASMVKMSLNSWGRYIQKPADAFTEMRSLLSGKIGDNFISAFMCCIDLDRGLVTSASAGHMPMIILRGSGETEVVKPAGRLIIDYGQASYEEIETVLFPGDTLVLYTDGVIESRYHDGRMIGMEKFTEMLDQGRLLSPDGLCGRIYDSIFDKNNNTIIDDDFALLVARYTG